MVPLINVKLTVSIKVIEKFVADFKTLCDVNILIYREQVSCILTNYSKVSHRRLEELFIHCGDFCIII